MYITRVPYMFLLIYVTYGRKRRNFQGLASSDGGISVAPAMALNPCIDENLGFDSPWCVASFPTIGIEQMDSKQEFLAPIYRQFPVLPTHTHYETSRPIVPLMESFIPCEGRASV